MAMSGRDLRRLLSEQFERDPDVHLQASGLTYERSGDDLGDVAVDGRALDPGRTYSVAANALLAERGGFAAFRAARRVQAVGTDLEALVSLLRTAKPDRGRPRRGDRLLAAQQAR
jgi:hypothetical protein